MISSSFASYELILILLSAAALIKAYMLWSRRKFPQGIRTVLGLSVLTILRTALLIAAVFGWQGQSFSPAYHLLASTVDFLSLLIILWMWIFPEPEPTSDRGAAAAAALAVLFSLSQLIVFPNLLNSFTASALLWDLFILILISAGAALLLMRKPNQYENGLLMVGIFATGLILNWIFPRPESYALNALQLSQLAGYPLLLILIKRFYFLDEEQGFQGPDEREKEDSRRRTRINYALMEHIQRLFRDLESGEMLYQIARCTSEILLADLSMIIDTPDAHGKVRIIAGFDLIREENLQAITLEAKSIPLLTNYISSGKMLHLPASSTSRDLSSLSLSLQLTSPGHLLAAPIEIPGADRTIGLVLFSPFSNRPWTRTDQDYLRLLAELYQAAFRHHLALDQEDPGQVKKTIRDLSSNLTRLTQEKQALQKDLSETKRELEEYRFQNQTRQESIQHLKKELHALQTHLRMLSDLAQKESMEAYQKYLSMVEEEIQLNRKERTAHAAAAQHHQKSDRQPAAVEYAFLPEILEQVREELQSLTAAKELTIKISLPESMPPLTMTSGLFQEILTILLTNAVQETKRSGDISLRTQIYQEDETLRFAHIKISDQGQGFSPKELNRILNNQLTEESQDSLTQQMTNLYVSKNLVENEGGRLWVESEPGQGTTVSLLLPLRGD
jgi:signal transduction histidine kinase